MTRTKAGRRGVSGRILLASILAAAAVGLSSSPTAAAPLTSVSAQPSSPTPSATNVTYTLTASAVTTTLIRCIRVEYDVAADGSGGKPAGMDLLGTELDASSTWVPNGGTWTSTNDNANGFTEITRPSGGLPAGSSNRTLVITGLVNPSTTTPFYVLIRTFTGGDCVSGPMDQAVTATKMNSSVATTAAVEPTMTFSVAGRSIACNGATPTAGTSSSGNSVGLGRISSAANAIAAQDLTVATNATSGAYVTIRGSGQLSSSSRAIAAVGGSNQFPVAFPTAGTEAFGYTTDDTSVDSPGAADRFTNGGPKWAALTTSDQPLIHTFNWTWCAAYQAGASTSTPAGTYSTTVVYTAVPWY